MFFHKAAVMPTPEQAPPGRDESIAAPVAHFVNGHSLLPPFSEGLQQAMFGLGCFWGAERRFWQQQGVYSTAVGYAGGFTPNPTYEEVCSGLTGHNEVVRVIFDPQLTDYSSLLRCFWESHDPTQGMRQGNDAGTQYRSGIYCYSPRQHHEAEVSKADYQGAIRSKGLGEITTEVLDAPAFYYAEAYHQQYLAKNPGGLLRSGWYRSGLPLIAVSIIQAAARS